VLALTCVIVPLACVAQEKPPTTAAIAEPPATPTTKPAGLVFAPPEVPGAISSLEVLVDEDGLRHNGEFMDVDTLRERIAQMPESDRSRTVLAVKAASPDITVERFFTATAALHQIVEQQHLKYLSQTGIAAGEDAGAKRSPTTRRAAAGAKSANAEAAQLAAQLKQGAAAGRTVAEVVSRAAASTREPGPQSPADVGQPPHAARTVAAASVADQLQARARAPDDEDPGQNDRGPRSQDPPTTAPPPRRRRSRRPRRKASMTPSPPTIPTMAAYLNTLNEMEMNLARLSQSVGAKSRVYQDAKQDLDLQRHRVSEYAQAYRRKMATTSAPAPATPAPIANPALPAAPAPAAPPRAARARCDAGDHARRAVRCAAEVLTCAQPGWLPLQSSPSPVDARHRHRRRVKPPITYRGRAARGDVSAIRPRIICRSHIACIAGDVLTVAVTDMVGPGIETRKVMRVSDSGTISLPLVGRIHVVGMTEEEINAVVNKMYRDMF
jgi:hypothetical protein